MRKNLQKGTAALLAIFMLGLIALLIGVTLLNTSYQTSIRGRSQVKTLDSYYAAESGIEEAMAKIQKSNFGNPGPDNFTITLTASRAEVKVYGSENQRTIESLGYYDKYLRRIKVVVQNTSSMPGFVNAIQAGNGGVELEGNTKVKGKGGVPGNVYSKSFIKGKSKDHTAAGCKNSASAIYGSAWAVDMIDSLDPGDGVCITANASATLLKSCYVHGKQFSPNAPLSSCDGGISQHVDTIPQEDLPDLGVNQIKSYLTSRGDDYSGNCKLTGSGNPSDCLGGTDSLGNIKINGDLEIDPNPGVILKFTGPIWVTGNLLIKSNSRIKPLSTSLSQITVVDGKIDSKSNVTYSKNVDAFLLFISTYISGPDSTDTAFCNNPAISLSSNNESVLFYATVGCVRVDTGTAVGGFKGALLGEAVRVKNNTEIEYDPDLQTAVFGLTESGGWQTLSYEEY